MFELWDCMHFFTMQSQFEQMGKDEEEFCNQSDQSQKKAGCCDFLQDIGRTLDDRSPYVHTCSTVGLIVKGWTTEKSPWADQRQTKWNPSKQTTLHHGQTAHTLSVDGIRILMLAYHQYTH